MEPQSLTDQLVELYRRLNQRAPEAETAGAIRQSQEDNGLLEAAPVWLTDALAAVLAGRTTGPVLFPSVGSDAGSFLMEVADLIPGWEHDDQGEYIRMRFPALGTEILIINEALTPEGKGCSSYSVQRT
jgi:hypothetical protein